MSHYKPINLASESEAKLINKAFAVVQKSKEQVNFTKYKIQNKSNDGDDVAYKITLLDEPAHWMWVFGVYKDGSCELWAN
jgi:hypothetical protein